MYIPPSTVERSHDLQNIHGTILVLNNTVGKLSSPRAESARAVTGRRCPHSGEGEDFDVSAKFFFTKTVITREPKVEKLLPPREMNCLSKG